MCVSKHSEFLLFHRIYSILLAIFLAPLQDSDLPQDMELLGLNLWCYPITFWHRVSIQSCPSSRLVSLPRLENPAFPTILLTASKRSNGSIPFLRTLIQSECKQPQPEFELSLLFSISLLHCAYTHSQSLYKIFYRRLIIYAND